MAVPELSVHAVALLLRVAAAAVREARLRLMHTRNGMGEGGGGFMKARQGDDDDDDGDGGDDGGGGGGGNAAIDIEGKVRMVSMQRPCWYTR